MSFEGKYMELKIIVLSEINLKKPTIEYRPKMVMMLMVMGLEYKRGTVWGN
jgi:hypothetical protein